MKCTVILDVTALRSYARLDGVAVGELIATVHDDGDIVGIPILVLLEVWTDLADDERAILTDLIERESSPVEVLPVDVTTIPLMSGLRPQTGYATAHAIALVLSHGAVVATYMTQAYTAHLDKFDILELS